MIYVRWSTLAFRMTFAVWLHVYRNKRRFFPRNEVILPISSNTSQLNTTFDSVPIKFIGIVYPASLEIRWKEINIHDPPPPFWNEQNMTLYLPVGKNCPFTPRETGGFICKLNVIKTQVAQAWFLCWFTRDYIGTFQWSIFCLNSEWNLTELTLCLAVSLDNPQSEFQVISTSFT